MRRSDPRIDGDTRPVVLIVAPFNLDPPYSGGPVRILGMARALRDAGIRTVVVAPSYTTLSRDGAGPAFDTLDYHVMGPRKRWAQFLNPWLIAGAAQKAREIGATHIIAASYAAGMNGVAISLAARKPLVFDEFNVEHQRFHRMGRRRLGAAMRTYERTIAFFSRRVLCVSADDREGLAEMGIPRSKLLVVPNGFDSSNVRFDRTLALAARAELGIKPEERLVLFFGKLDYQPNREAALLIAEGIAPQVRQAAPETHFALVGGNPPPGLQRPGVHVLGPVPALEPILMGADAVVAPLRSGGGTKLKIVEALAHGKTVVTTPVGAEGLPKGISRLLVAPSPEDCAAKLIEALPYARFDATTSRTDEELIAEFSWSRATLALQDALTRRR